MAVALWLSRTELFYVENTPEAFPLKQLMIMDQDVSISPPDCFHVSSAQGWLGLNNAEEAAIELEKIHPDYRCFPEIVEIEWQIEAKRKRWENCLKLANHLTALVPNQAQGWIHLAFTLHEMQETQRAWDVLLLKVDIFPKEWIIRYNLACYAAKLGKAEEAKEWLDCACLFGSEREILGMALEDPDLKSIWPSIRKPPRRS